MSLWRTIVGGLRALFRRAQVERELDDEIQHYLALATEERLRAGLSPERAAREARLELGSIAATKETVRGGGWEAGVETLGRDVAHALRMLQKNPGLTIATVLTLALGLGATTVMFSVVNGVLLAPLPFRAPGRLVAVINTGSQSGDYLSPLDVRDWHQQIHDLDPFGTFVWGSVNLTDGTAPVRLATADVSANWFTLLGVPPQLGRAFAPGEDHLGEQHVVVLSDVLWRTRFGGDPGVIGRTIRLDDVPYTVIGVAPRHFTLPDNPDLWRPLAIAPALLAPSQRGFRILQVIGRLRTGVTLDQARSEVRTVTARLKQEYPEPERGLSFDLMPLRRHIVGDARPALLVLLGTVGCVLLIACVNVATLLLVRATSRSAEIGIRMALGAGRGRIVRQLLAESMLLALVGGGLGVALAAWGVRAIAGAHVGHLPLLENVTIDLRVLSFALALMVGTGVLFGLAPALQAAGTDVLRALRSGTRGSSARKGSARLRAALVVTELALAVPLLIGATLLGRSFMRLLAVDPGFRAEHVVRFDLTLPFVRYDSAARVRGFTDELVQRLESLPETQAAAAGVGVPFTDWIFRTVVQIEGRPPASAGHTDMAEYKVVTPHYWRALGIPLVRGRMFTADDRPGGRKVVVVNQAFVRQYFPHADPIGRTITGYGAIVGVVGDTKADDLATPAQPALYVPYDQSPFSYLTFVIRSTADPGTVLAAARAQVRALDSTLPLFHTMSLEDAVRASAARPRLDAWLVGGFAAMALLLAVVGIYGVISYAVHERQRELGIRIALGARRAQVMVFVLRQGLWLAAAGVCIGLALAVAGSRVLRSLLFGIGPLDVTTYSAVCGVLIIVAAVASWLPARRAAHVDPMIAMRPE